MSALMKWDFGMLDHQVDSCLKEHAAHRIQTLEKMKPFLLEIQARLSAQGRRTDLKDTPNLTFTQYLESKEKVFQYSVRSIKLFLSEGTTTRLSQPRALKAQSSDPVPTTSDPVATTPVPADVVVESGTWGPGGASSYPIREKNIPDINEFAMRVACRINCLLAENAPRREDREMFDQLAALLKNKGVLTTSRRSLTMALEKLSARARELRAKFDQSPSRLRKGGQDDVDAGTRS